MNAPAAVAVAYFSPNGAVNGALLDALDAVVFLRSSGVEVDLVVVGMAESVVARIVADRYPESGLAGPADSVRFCRFRFTVPRHRYAVVLAGYGSFRRLASWIQAAQWLVLPSQRLHRDARRGCIRDHRRAVFLLDPEQHDYRVRSRRDYLKKVLPPQFRGGAVDQALLINAVSPHKRYSVTEFEAWMRKAQVPSKVRILSSRSISDLPQDWEVIVPPVDGLLGMFSDYLYAYPVGGYDENPRLLIESLLLGRRVHFMPAATLDPACRHKIDRVIRDPQRFVLTDRDPLLQWIREAAQ